MNTGLEAQLCLWLSVGPWASNQTPRFFIYKMRRVPKLKGPFCSNDFMSLGPHLNKTPAETH